eukprot:1182148-Prorocentrum_minimum.AAC.2
MIARHADRWAVQLFNTAFTALGKSAYGDVALKPRDVGGLMTFEHIEYDLCLNGCAVCAIQPH